MKIKDKVKLLVKFLLVKPKIPNYGGQLLNPVIDTNIDTNFKLIITLIWHI